MKERHIYDLYIKQNFYSFEEKNISQSHMAFRFIYLQAMYQVFYLYDIIYYGI